MTEKRAKPDQFQLRLPPGLRERIKVYAERHGRSMNEEIVRLLEREFPKPWDVDARIADLLNLLLVIRQGDSDEKIFQLANKLEETLIAITGGQVGGVDKEALAKIDWRWERYCEEKMEDDRDELNLDAEEAEQLNRSGNTAKFVDIEEPARLELIKSLFPDLREEHIKMISSALEIGTAEAILKTVGDAINREKLEQRWANSSNNLDEDIPF